MMYAQRIMIMLLASVAPAIAVPVTMVFQGEVVEHSSDPVPSIGDDYPIGTQYQGFLSYDTEVISYEEHVPYNYYFRFDSSALLSIEIGEQAYDSYEFQIALYSREGYDSIRIESLDTTLYEETDWSICFRFVNHWDPVYQSTSLPTAPLTLSDWRIAQMGIWDDSLDPSPYVEGNVMAITPEPASLALLAIGGLAVVRRW